MWRGTESLTHMHQEFFLVMYVTDYFWSDVGEK